MRYALAITAAISCAGPPASPVRHVPVPAPPVPAPAPPVPAPAPPAEVDRSDAAGEEASRRGYDLLVEGRAAEAIAPLRKAYAIAKERHPGTALAGISAATLAEAVTDSGDCANALPIYDEAITVLDAVLSHADPKLSLLIGRKVSCLLMQHRDDDARRILTALLERARTERYSVPAEIVARAHDMANQLVDGGDLVGAALLFESSIAAIRAMTSPAAAQHAWQASSDLAALYEKADLPTEELATLRTMIDLPVPDEESRCALLGRLATAALHAGSVGEARPYVDQALACPSLRDPEWIASISFQFSRLGHPGLAQRVVDDALALPISRAGKAHLLYVTAIAQLVELDPCEAERTTRRALALLSPRDDATQLAETRKVNNQAVQSCANEKRARTAKPLRRTGDPVQRLAAVREDLARAQEKYDPASQSVLGRRFNLALELHEQGQDAEACRELGSVAMQFTTVTLGFATEVSRAAQIAQQHGFTTHLIDALVSSCVGGSAADLVEPLLYLKGHVLEGVRQEAALTRLANTREHRELVLRLREARSQIAKALLASSGGSGVAAATRAKEELERKLATDGKVPSSIEPLGLIGGAAGLRRSLNADEAYIDLTAYEAGVAREPHLLALVLTRDTAKAIELGRIEPIAAARDAWLSAIASWQSAGRDALAKLRSVLFQRVLDALPSGIGHLIVSPIGGLDGVPWQHPDLAGPSRTVWIVPSARELVRWKLAVDGSTFHPGTRQLVVDDIDFDAGTGTLVDVDHRLFALPRAAPIAAPPGVSVTRLTGPGATREKLLAALGSTQLLHVVTHGVFVEPTERRELFQRNPFASSAVALAGANRRDRTGRRQGVVSAEELVGLAGPELQLATLGMCDSARGASVPGQGTLGLATALGAAGTPVIVASAWHASFESANALFPDFYARLFAAAAPREAFDAAIAKLRRDPALRGARHWAGWLFLGYTRPSGSITLAMSRLAHRLCTCRPPGCTAWKDPAEMDRLKQILETPGHTPEDEQIVLGLLGSLKQCQPVD